MIALVRAELRQLRTTRSTWALLAVALLLCVVVAALALGRVGGIDTPPRGTVELRDMLLGSSGAAMLPVVLLSVLAVTGEFQHRTATSMFLAVPGRHRVILAKAIACTLLATVAAIPLMTVLLAMGVGSGAIDLTLAAHELPRPLGGLWLVFACWALLGVGVGVLVRNQTVALLVPLLWFGVVETLAPNYPGLAWLVPWLPGPVTAAIGGAHAPGLLPVWAAVLVLLGYLCALLVPGTRRIARLDVI
jgi:ABC-2 type transport system permease protein